MPRRKLFTRLIPLAAAALAIVTGLCAYLCSNLTHRHALINTAPFILELTQALTNAKAQELTLGIMDCYGTAFAKDYASADGALARADAHILRALGPRSYTYCVLIYNRAALAERCGHATLAEQFFNKVVECFPTSGSQIGKVYAADNLAYLLYNKDRERSLKLRQDNVSRTAYLAATDSFYATDYITALEKLGFTYQLSSDYASAIQTFARQLEATKQAHGETSWRYGECLLELGRAELAQRQCDIAAKHLRQALNLFETTHSSNWTHNQEQGTLCITDELLAQNSLRLNDIALAKKYLGDAIQIRRATNNIDATDYVRLSRIQRLNGNYAASEEILTDAAYLGKSPELLQEKTTIAALQHKPIDALRRLEQWSIAMKGCEAHILVSEKDFEALATKPLIAKVQTNQPSRRQRATLSINNLDSDYLLTAAEFQNLITTTAPLHPATP